MAPETLDVRVKSNIYWSHIATRYRYDATSANIPNDSSGMDTASGVRPRFKLIGLDTGMRHRGRKFRKICLLSSLPPCRDDGRIVFSCCLDLMQKRGQTCILGAAGREARTDIHRCVLMRFKGIILVLV
jgi:hypothetical protein